LKKIGETGLKDWRTVVSQEFDPSFTKREEKWWACCKYREHWENMEQRRDNKCWETFSENPVLKRSGKQQAPPTGAQRVLEIPNLVSLKNLT
jgi:hypothetical protein